MPLVSCWVATKDRPTLVARSVRSALDQAFPVGSGLEVEVLVLDDGPIPVDRTGVATWGDARVRYMRCGSMSLALKRNYAATISRGDYYAQFDDDDWSAPGRVAAQVAAVNLPPPVPGVEYAAAVLGPRLVCHDLDTGAVYVNCLARGQWFDCGMLLKRKYWREVPDEWQHLMWLMGKVGGPERRSVVDDVSLVISGIDDWNRPRRNLDAPRWKPWKVAPASLYDGSAPWHDAPRRYGR